MFAPDEDEDKDPGLEKSGEHFDAMMKKVTSIVIVKTPKSNVVDHSNAQNIEKDGNYIKSEEQK